MDRANVYDNDEFDVFNKKEVDKSKIHKGKKSDRHQKESMDKASIDKVAMFYKVVVFVFIKKRKSIQMSLWCAAHQKTRYNMSHNFYMLLKYLWKYLYIAVMQLLVSLCCVNQILWKYVKNMN